MVETILLLAPEFCSAVLSDQLTACNPGLRILSIVSVPELAALPRRLLATSRLIGFATPVIVPAAFLARLGYGAYNFHPGPPSYPGTVPAQMAIYEGAQFFGATAHEMVERVDAGPIVGMDLCALPPEATAVEAEMLALDLLLKLFSNLSYALTEPQPLPRLPVTWASRKSTRATLAGLCALPLDISAHELARRVKAIDGNHLGYELTVTLHGRRFRLVAEDLPDHSAATLQSTPILQNEPSLRRA
jgi:methionyl-tRNA formyltransferase